MTTRRTMVSVVDHSTSPPSSNEKSNNNGVTDTPLNCGDQSSFHRYVAQQQKLGAFSNPLRVESTSSPAEVTTSTLVTEVSSFTATDHLLWMQRLAKVVQEIQRLPDFEHADSGWPQYDQMLRSSERLLEATEGLPDNLSSVTTDAPTTNEQVVASTKKSLAQIHFAFLNHTTQCIHGLRGLLRTDATPQSESYLSDDSASHKTDGVTVSAFTAPSDRLEVLMGIDQLRCMALSLTRRTHSLGLPFHWPLYQSLMEVIALSAQFSPKEDIRDCSSTSSSGGVHDMIHQVVTFTHTRVTPPPVVDKSLKLDDDYAISPTMIWRPSSALFRPALVALLREEAFVETLDLLRYVRDQYGLAVLDLITTASIYETIYEKVSQSFRLRMRCSCRSGDEPITEIIAMLEPSVMIVKEEWDRQRRQQEETYNQLIDALDNDAFERFADSLHQYEAKARTDLEELEDGDDDSVDTDESTNGSLDVDDDDSEDERASRRSMDRSIHRMITRRVKSESAKQIMETLVPYSISKMDSSTSAASVPKMVTVHVQPQVSPNATVKFHIDDIEILPKQKKEPRSSSSQSEANMDQPQDAELIPSTSQPMELTDVNDRPVAETLDENHAPLGDTQQTTTNVKLEGTHELEEADAYDDEFEEDWSDEADNRFPDITHQVVELNESRYLSFTRKYADILWLRESMDEDGEEYEDEKSRDASRRAGGLDSDDDDDDEYDYVTDSDEDDSDDEGSSR